MKQLLKAEEAISLVRQCEMQGTRVLGVDGFLKVPDGFEASLDLILDVSHKDLSVSEAARRVEEFIEKHEGENVFFEVCIE